MGGYYSTNRIRGSDGEPYNLVCFLKKKHFTTSFHWNLHKGLLSDKQKVIVKVCPDPDMSQRECQAAVRKLHLAELVVRRSPELRKMFVVANTYEAVVTKNKKTVVVQERHNGNIQTFFDLKREKTPCWRPGSMSPFHDLVLASYRVSGGRYVISAVKGVKLERYNFRMNDTNDYGSAKFLITSLTVQSAHKEFGVGDNGMDGIQTFLKSANSFVPKDLLDAGDFADKLRAKRTSKEKPQITVSSENSADSCMSSSDNCSEHGSQYGSEDTDTVTKSGAVDLRHFLSSMDDSDESSNSLWT